MNVTGIVKDGNGNPAAGLLISVVGTAVRAWIAPVDIPDGRPPGGHPRTGVSSASTGTQPAMTDASGRFTVSVPTPQPKLPPGADWNGSVPEHYSATVTVFSPTHVELTHETQTSTSPSFAFTIQVGLDAPAPTVHHFSAIARKESVINYVPSGVDLLSTFFFMFEHGNDNHLQMLGIKRDWPSQNKMTATLMAFADDDPTSSDDDFFYNVAFVDSSYADVYSGTTGADVFRGSGTHNLTPPAGDHVFVLRGFNISYHGQDHHLEEITILENNGQLSVTFNDENHETIICEVWYAWVPRGIFREVGETSGRARGGHRDAIPAGTAVVRGFHYKFLNGDHHIRDIGVWMPGDGRLEQYYEDHNGDDEFEYTVRWAVLPQTLAVLAKPSPKRAL